MYILNRVVSVSHNFLGGLGFVAGFSGVLVANIPKTDVCGTGGGWSLGSFWLCLVAWLRLVAWQGGGG